MSWALSNQQQKETYKKIDSSLHCCNIINHQHLLNAEPQFSTKSDLKYLNLCNANAVRSLIKAACQGVMWARSMKDIGGTGAENEPGSSHL